ncbi:uncharacterized protein LOC135922294 [Gordionus sp. m RMFG-2023]|uniref:uncharacterized protein LOC135922294 n=1 Tax=Gordionus sp. m RMFG-2023 TaxID=3053472 RepID=UPI0031FD29D5
MILPRTPRLSFSNKATIDAKINGLQLAMEFDTGAACSVIDEVTWNRIGRPQLSPAYKLVGYNHIQIEVLGEIKLQKAIIRIEPNTLPIALPARRVPFPLPELDRLLDEDVIKKVDPTITPITWATPTVNILKKSGAVRICGDFRLTINKYLAIDNDLLPTFVDLTKDTIIPYSADIPVVISCDASEDGLGAVIAHRFLTGQEKPTAYALRTLSAAEKNYATIDREVSAIMFAIEKFHQYIFGRHFILVTDHKPLQYILGDKRDLNKITNNRLIRWATKLLNYDYEIIYRPGNHNKCADALSRLGVEKAKTNDVTKKFEEEIRGLKINLIEDLSFTRSKVVSETSNDINLKEIIKLIKNHCPKSNGLAERYIQTIKTRFYAGRRCGTPDQLNLANVLITHRNTPNATTGKFPAEMMFGRSLRTTLDQWKLSTRERKENALWKQKYYKDRSVEPREFEEQQKVRIANERTAGWHEGKVLQRKSAILYDVKSEGIVKNKHADQLRDAHTQEKEIPVTLTEEVEKAEHENTTLEKRVSKPPLRYHDEFNL